MPFFTLLDTAIGLVLVFSLLSLLVSSICEAISQFLALRGKILSAGIAGMVTDPELREKLLLHPLIRSLGQIRKDGSWRPPSYIPADLFVTALLAEIRKAGEDPSEDKKTAPIANSFDALVELLDRLPASGTRDALLSLSASGEREIGAARKRFERWFDQTMDRTSGWYHRRMRLILLFIATLLVVPLNLDTVEMAETLWVSPAVRAGMVTIAEEQSKKVLPADGTATGDAGDSMKKLVDNVRNFGSLDLPLGWESEDLAETFETLRALLAKSFGLLVTILAAALGANFWYDILKRLIRIRAAGPPPDAVTDLETS